MNNHPFHALCFRCKNTAPHKFFPQFAVTAGSVREKAFPDRPVRVRLRELYVQFFFQRYGFFDPLFPVFSPQGLSLTAIASQAGINILIARAGTCSGRYIDGDPVRSVAVRIHDIR